MTTTTERGQDPRSQRLRALCTALPGVSERTSHGEPTWFVGGRVFVMLADHHHDDRLAFWCAAADGEQAALVAADPLGCFVPPYVGARGWVGWRLDADDVDWAAVADRVEQAYRRIAPARLQAQLEATS